MKTFNRLKRNRGVTVIELMVVIACISIILVIAIPVYQQYATRAKVSEGLSLANSVLLAIAEYYQTNSELPTSNPQAGLPPSTDYATDFVEEIEVSGSPPGNVEISYDTSNIPDLTGQNVLIFVPSTTSGNTVEWSCLGGTLPPWARPPRCRP